MTGSRPGACRNRRLRDLPRLDVRVRTILNHAHKVEKLGRHHEK